MPTDLFAATVHEPAHILLEGGELLYFRHWLRPAQADMYMQRLLRETRWEQSTIRLAGKPIKIPRLNAWYGDAGSQYRYSGTLFKPLPWNRPLGVLRIRLEFFLQQRFNSVLVNQYRDGGDSVSWHADDEPELGPNPLIASVSLGQERRFLLKPKRTTNAKLMQKPMELVLTHGSLLVMKKDTQHNWMHSIPKTQRPVGPRINLTYRTVKSLIN